MWRILLLVIISLSLTDLVSTESQVLRIDSVMLSADSLSDSKHPRDQCFASLSRGELNRLSVFFEGDWLSVPDQEIGEIVLPDLSEIRLSIVD